MNTDPCNYCGHTWHGLTCGVTVRKACECPSAHPEFREGAADVACGALHEDTGAQCFLQADNHNLRHQAWGHPGQVVTWLVEDEALNREMAYTDYQSSCRSQHPDHETVVCRRGINAHTTHAAGYGSTRLTWPGVCERFDFPIVPIATRTGEAS